MAAEALEVKTLGKELVMPKMSIFLAIILWAMIYDTVYAHQDLKDDIKAGVKFIAVRFAHSTKGPRLCACDYPSVSAYFGRMHGADVASLFFGYVWWKCGCFGCLDQISLM